MTLKEIERRLNLLEKAFIDSQKRNVYNTDKIESMKSINPAVLFSKTAYIDDTGITFENVPSGNIEVFFNGTTRDCEIERIENSVRLTFSPLEELTQITIVVK